MQLASAFPLFQQKELNCCSKNNIACYAGGVEATSNYIE